MGATEVDIVSSENETKLDFAIHLPPSFLDYHPILSAILSRAFPVIRWEEDRFDNWMPKIVVGSADHLVMLSLMNGDNWTRSVIDLFLAGHFKQDGVGGRNVNKLGLLEIFYDQRMDRRGLKYFFINAMLRVFAVKGQGSFTKLIAKLVSHVTEVDYRVRIDPHSSLDAFQSQKEGIEVVDLTVAFEMLDNLIQRGIINDDLDNVIAGIDLGNLPLVKAIYKRYEWDLAVMDKKRISVGKGVDSTVTSKLIYGDVRDKRVILVDDMISSGSTLIETVREIIDNGAAEVIICAIHPVLVKDYYKKLEELLGNEKVKVVMTTNSIPVERPFSGERPVKKSIPYIKKGGGEQKVEIFNVYQFIGMVVQVLMNTGGDVGQIKEELAKYVVEPANKINLFRELTDMDYPSENMAGIYLRGSKAVFFNEGN